jgi:hypothetical protein
MIQLNRQIDTLLLMVSQSLCLGAKPTLGLWPDVISRLKASVRKLLSCLCGAPSLTKGRVCFNQFLPNNFLSKSKLHYDRQSVGQSILVLGTHRDPRPNFPISFLLFLDSCGFDGGRPFWREDGYVICMNVISGLYHSALTTTPEVKVKSQCHVKVGRNF